MSMATGNRHAFSTGLTVTCTLCDWCVDIGNLCSIPEECRVCSNYALLISPKTAHPPRALQPPVKAAVTGAVLAGSGVSRMAS